MIRLAGVHGGQVVLDPMCGAGSILAEQLVAAERARQAMHVAGGDIEAHAVRAAAANLRRLGRASLAHWDARRLPIASSVIDHVVSNPPFGKQLSSPTQIRPLYAAMIREYDRVLQPGGQAVLLVSDAAALSEAVREVPWRLKRQLRVRVLGQPARMSAWRKEKK